MGILLLVGILDKVGMRLAFGIPVPAFPCGGVELASGCAGLTDAELAWCLGDASAATPPVRLGDFVTREAMGVVLLGVVLLEMGVVLLGVVLLEMGVVLLPTALPDLFIGVALLLAFPEWGVVLRGGPVLLGGVRPLGGVLRDMGLCRGAVAT